MQGNRLSTTGGGARLVAPCRESAGRHRAFTLVELLVVISLATVVLSTTAVVLSLLLRGDASAREAIVVHRRVARLVEQFRTDVHAASNFEVVQSEVESETGKNQQGPWRLTLSDGRVVEYRWEDHGLVRLERQDNAVLRRETYRLSRGLAVSVDKEPLDLIASEATLVVLRIEPAERVGALPVGRLRVEAVLGKDLQLGQTVPAASGGR